MAGNFLGGKDGKMMYATSTEADREYYRLAPKYNSVTDTSLVSDKKEYTYFLKVKEEHIDDSSNRSSGTFMEIKHLVNAINQFQDLANMAWIFIQTIQQE
jgi:hypothetical protein